MKVLIYHHSRQHIYRLVEGMEKYRIPYNFYTGLYHTCLPDFIKKTFLDLKKTRFSPRIHHENVHCLNLSWEFLFSLWAKSNIFMRMRNRLLFKKQLIFQKNLLNLITDDTTHIITFHTNAFYLYPKLKKEYTSKKTLILEAAQPHPLWIKKLYQKYPEYRQYFPLNYSETMISHYSEEFKYADIVVAPSTFLKKTLLENKVDENKITIVFHGFNYTENLKNNHKKHRASKRLNVAFCGLLSFSKGFHFLKEVASKTTSFADFHVFGNAVSKRILKNLPQNVNLYGFVNHNTLFNIYQNMDVFYFPTLYDASGLALLEAMAMGLVPVASPYSIAPDIIENNANGFIVEPDEIEKTIEILHDLFTNREKLFSMSESIRKSVLKFTWENYQRQYVKLIKGDV